MQIIICGINKSIKIIEKLLPFSEIIVICSREEAEKIQYTFDIKIIIDDYFSDNILKDEMLYNKYAVIANTNNDDTNVLICKTFKHYLNIKLCIAILNYPKLEKKFLKNKLNIDYAIYPYENIISQITDQIRSFNFKEIITINKNINIYSINLGDEKQFILDLLEKNNIDIIGIIHNGEIINYEKNVLYSDVNIILICILDSENIKKIQKIISEQMEKESIYIFGSGQICTDLIHHILEVYKKIYLFSDKKEYLEYIYQIFGNKIDLLNYDKYDQSIIEKIKNDDARPNIALLRESDIDNIFLYLLFRKINFNNALIQIKNHDHHKLEDTILNYTIINPNTNYISIIFNILFYNKTHIIRIAPIGDERHYIVILNIESNKIKKSIINLLIQNNIQNTMKKKGQHFVKLKNYKEIQNKDILLSTMNVQVIKKILNIL